MRKRKIFWSNPGKCWEECTYFQGNGTRCATGTITTVVLLESRAKKLDILIYQSKSQICWKDGQ